MPEQNLKDKFVHRDLSWLSFNERVLEEALDADNPLAERLRFIAIFANNLDEFYMVRFAGLKRLVDSNYTQADDFGWYPQDLLVEVKSRLNYLNKRLYDAYQGKLAKELAKAGIAIKKYDELGSEQKKFVKNYFENTLFPIITPMAVDQGRPLPVLPSRTIAFAALLNRYNNENLAIVPIPRATGRMLKIPTPLESLEFISLEEVIRANLETLFRGYKLSGAGLFRVIRDGEIYVDEEYAPNLLRAIESEVKKRSKARVVILEAEKDFPRQILGPLCQALEFPEDQAVTQAGDLDLTYLFEVVGQIGRPQAYYKSFAPAKLEYENIFDRVRESDFLLHLPYQSFVPTAELVQEAARCPDVLAIKMTLYRTNESSGVVKALKEAAKNKKQVTVLVELKARFDEERNISWARDLEESGCHVIYGLAGMKIHSKMTLVVRREEGKIRRYVHLSTGNYNERTAAVYTDVGYFTANEDFGRDVAEVFNVITGYSVLARAKKVVAAPGDLRQYFFELIDKEIENQKKNKNGFIFAKMNSLEDAAVAEKLYQASRAGVKIRLIVRGICVLLADVKDLSENIEVKSVVGRLLEHSRIYIFGNNANPRVFLASADWMRRNFDRRIELLFEIEPEKLKEELRFIMDTYWKDNAKAWTMSKDGGYGRQERSPKSFNAQEFFIKHYCNPAE